MTLATFSLLPDISAPDASWYAGVVAVAAIVILASAALGRGSALLLAALSIAALAIIDSPAIPIAVAVVLLALVISARLRGRPYRRSTLALGRECALILGSLAAYTALRLIESDPPPAFANADRIISFERSLGLYVEPDVQAWVMKSDFVTRIFNWVYSFAFLAVTAGALIWLWFTDDRNYRLLRNVLGISALLAIITIAAFPTAPPRLMDGSGMVDTIVVFGREHAYANEFAAVPSLHVGWMVAVGYALGASLGGKRGVAIGVLPGALMMFTVIVTGNHFWMDGVIGAAYALGAAFVLSGVPLRAVRALPRAIRWSAGAGPRDGRHPAAAVFENPRTGITMLALGTLLSYLIVEQIYEPGFTDFWGYLVGQVAVILLLLIAGEVLFARVGGLSWLTHGVAIACCYADVFGTDGNLYARIDEYDKLTHFLGIAAVTAGLYDCLRGLDALGHISQPPNVRLWIAFVSGVAVGIGWEVYELLGDKVFHTARVYGPWDTGNDILSNTAGAMTVGVLLWLAERTSEHARDGEPVQSLRRSQGD